MRMLKGLSRLIPCESGTVRLAGRELRMMPNKQISQLMCILSQSNQTPMFVTRLIHAFIRFGGRRPPLFEQMIIAKPGRFEPYQEIY
ncbi:hypothetical protein [Paenibacillus azoreducens]|uniref:Uncharacterized protein n=1 Tax=Paenibacillus azoreducens TaxID=116718 RepID=A0A919YBA0_9BACL|nr:hypothetical protein [Paenibacillus azoreducens]GIO47566.1 hypothetical protein J34TS1_23310 [Paenibacillus azoreducens]